MGANTHLTTVPKQRETDTFAVYQAVPGEGNLQLIGFEEVPRYTQPDELGIELSEQKRLALAVNRAVRRVSNAPILPDLHVAGPETIHQLKGTEFMVMTDMDEPMEFVEFEMNPAFEGVWDPSEEDSL